ncbi:acetylxylan esterase [Curtobacterium sp. MWU13-2055]|uniref:acetylxylan esterase n=1 Tax=Curtobacterium sp. MWU13-2055 TaxID=2931928 RepID=UPI00200EAFC0|nr:acetylxylan esterase [Curtobacterium sp. MWU13-2055]
MALTDIPVEKLRDYQSEVTDPADFDDFWAQTLQSVRNTPLEFTMTPVEGFWRTYSVWDVTFNGANGAPIKAWLTAPNNPHDALPAVVEYNGYGGGRGLAGEHAHWADAGFAHLFMDTRGQGGAWGSGGDTVDPDGTGSTVPGSMTRGILNRDDYYYRRVFTDAVRAVDAVREVPFVDTTRVAVRGASQGGGIALAVAGLIPDLAAVLTDVPFLCDFPRGTAISPTDPYGEIVRFLRVYPEHCDQVFDTLRYFDGVNFARRATAPALFSVGLMDPVCPPSTVYGAFNRYAGARELVEYPFGEHSGGGFRQQVRQTEWLQQLLQSA